MDQPVRMRMTLVRGLPRPVWQRGYWSRTLADYDAPALHALLAPCYEADGMELPPYAAWRRRLWEDPEFDRSLCFLALDGRRRIVGAAQCWISGFVKDLAVAPEHRRKGLAAALMLTAFREYRRRGVRHVELKTEPDNAAALALYRGLGMREVVPDDAEPGPRHGIVAPLR